MGKTRSKRTHENEDDDAEATYVEVDANTPVLRRSTRKRSRVAENPFPTPPTTNKKKAREKVPLQPKNFQIKVQKLILPPKLEPTLITLPVLVLKKLLLYIDVKSLEVLSKTCSYFDLLINGQFLPSLSIPFDAHFLKEIYQTDVIEKKPLLQLKCAKSRESFGHVFIGDRDPTSSYPVFSDDRSTHGRKVLMMARMSIHNVVKEDLSTEMTDYLIYSQLSLLNLDKLREVDLLPEDVDEFSIDANTVHRYPHHKRYKQFDFSILHHLEVNSWLTNVSRLSIMIFLDIDPVYIEDFIQPEKMPNLQELEIAVTSRIGSR